MKPPSSVISVGQRFEGYLLATHHDQMPSRTRVAAAPLRRTLECARIPDIVDGTYGSLFADFHSL